MKDVLRKAAFAVPFGALVALAAHSVRFGDDHAFGGDANELVVAVATGGSIAIGLAILHAFLTSGSTVATGTVVAARARRLIAGPATLFTIAAAIYYGIESLEGHGIEAGFPLALLAVFASLAAAALRLLTDACAHFVADIVRDAFAQLDRREHIVLHRALRPQPIHSQVAQRTRRFGRAPPNGRFRS